MQSMGPYASAGTGFAAEKDAAAAGVRGMRQDMWQRVFDMRQKQGDRHFKHAAKDRRMGMIAAGLGGASTLPWANWLKGTQQPPMGGMGYAPMDDSLIRQTLGI
jgi:hypothetical protein